MEPRTYRLAGERFIAGLHQPALVYEFGLRSEADPGHLLRDCEFDPAALRDAESRVSPAELLKMIGNTARAVAQPDTSFLLGQQWLPGHYGPASHALVHAGSLGDALAILCRHHATLTPLLRPRLLNEGDHAVLYWTDSFGSPALRPLLVELHMSAVTAMCRWLAGERLPWRFCFNRARPRHAEQHAVHLGSALRFDCQLDAQIIDADWLRRPWPRAQIGAMQASLHGAEADAEARDSLPSCLYDHLLANIRTPPTLESTATDFGISPATLKRHLMQHGTHFQAELDLVRAHVSIYLMQIRGLDNEAVADHLGFHDARNFRRSFIRWTGLTPRGMRNTLLPA
ncbi:MAG: AraC family transcriptional regulator [Burkholderiales bacterium]|nr:AraC family transcriptional regulator [Burkholderiales bacterium]